MIKQGDKSISIYKGDYRPVSTQKNGKEIHGFNIVGTQNQVGVFENTFNDYITIYGMSAHDNTVNSGSQSPDNPKKIISSLGTILTQGKNLFNVSKIRGKSVSASGGILTCNTDSSITASGIPTDQVCIESQVDVDIPQNSIITLSANGEFSNISCVVNLKDLDGNYITEYSVNSTNRIVTVDLSQYTNFKCVSFRVKNTQNSIPMSGTAYFQLEMGSEATEYFPYFDENSTIPLVMNGILVSNSENYNYSKIVDQTEKFYICDVLKGNKFTQNIGVITFNGSETYWNTNITSFDGGDTNIFSCSFDQAKSIKNSMCTHFVRSFNIDADRVHGGFSNSPATYYNLRFCVSKSMASTLSQWKNWLAQQDAAGTPVTVYYVIKDPVEEEFKVIEYPSKLELPVLKTIPRYTRVTVIPSDGYLSYEMGKCIKTSK